MARAAWRRSMKGSSSTGTAAIPGSPFAMAQFLAIGTDGMCAPARRSCRRLREASCTINEVEERPDGVKVGAIVLISTIRRGMRSISTPTTLCSRRLQLRKATDK
jgi:hypothetical protein